MTILEDLYYGNITPVERSIVRDSELDKLVKLLSRNEEAISSSLTEKQLEAFGKFKETQYELSGNIEKQAFIDGFILATKIMVEVMSYRTEQ